MIRGPFVGVQGRLTLENRELYNAHLKQDNRAIPCQTVSHLQIVPYEAQHWVVFAGRSESRGKIP
jgi:hypothetical protein